MKYLRKIIALLIGVVLFAALVIGIGKIFAVKNINVTLITYADDCTESYTKAKDDLNGFKGSSLLFLSIEDVEKTFKDSNYTVTSCEKKFPCTVNISLKERLETYAVAVTGGGIYSMYDNDGKFLRSWVENTNVNDNSPNVELLGIPFERISEIAVIGKQFKDSFKCLRSIVTSIRLDSKPDVEGYTEKLYINLRCGLKIQLDDYSNDTEEKIKVAFSKFGTLSDRQKLGGTIRSYRIGGVDGLINADYSPL